MAGIPKTNLAFYRRIRFLVGDPAALVEIPADGGTMHSTLILRDIEMQRARQHARADRVACPADFTPEGGLSGDRETATAQAAAECLRQAGVQIVHADRSLPLIYSHYAKEAGIEVVCDPEYGILERRAKDADEVAALRKAQQVTEQCMQMACELVARAEPRSEGHLYQGGEPLTSESLKAEIDVWLLKRGFTNPESIVACGPAGADCHNTGSGPLVTGQPVIIDIFPQDRETLYNGDCTRTVVNGVVPDVLATMHVVVVEAKAAATAAAKPGATGEDVHNAARAVILDRGYQMGLPGEDEPRSYCAMTHGTGHGIGLDVHEPPLLDFGGPPLVVGDALTIEPGLYRRDLGGVRVEDMVVVTADGCENLNTISEGLTWA
jgi:Xaa-Pro aminopeptidase